MARTLQLHRPLISFDLETTGLHLTDDRIIELSCIKLLPQGGRDRLTLRLNPERPISQEATAIHGLTLDDLVDCPTFAEIAAELAAFMADSDLTGFNIERFDIPMLAQEFQRVGRVFPSPDVSVIDSFRIFCQCEPRDLAAAYAKYCGKSLKDAHSAEADAVAAADVLEAQLKHYDDLPLDPAGLHVFCHPTRSDWLDGDGKIVWQGGQAVLGFGKHRGRSLREMKQNEANYLRWMAQGNFSREVQKLCQDALEGIFPDKDDVAAARGQQSNPQAHLQDTPRQASLF